MKLGTIRYLRFDLPENPGQFVGHNAMKTRQLRRRRIGQIAFLLAVLLPAFCAVLGLLFDGGMMMSVCRQVQQVADAAATAAAMELSQGATSSAAQAVALQYVQQSNGLMQATVQVNIPPSQGPYAGIAGFAEVTIAQPVPTYFIQVVCGNSSQTVTMSSVAGQQAATAGAAVVVLDPNPPSLSLPPLSAVTSLLPAVPLVLGGMQVLGLGNLKVQGSVLVNTTWGGWSQNNQLVGSVAPPPYAVSCTPLVGLTTMSCSNLRVVGGVDNPKYYLSLTTGGASPLQAGKLPVDDPLLSLPVPTVAADSANVSSTYYGGKSVISLPLLPTTLYPGVYDWIEVVSGPVTFEPGVYIIRSVNPLTGIGLSLLAGQITANGVMFYITPTTSYTPLSGSPDSADGSSVPPNPGVSTLIPSAVINIGLLGSQFSPLSDSSSPFNGMFLFQRRYDRRPIILAQESLLLGGQMSGTVYAKWGNLVLGGLGTYNARFVTGTLTVATVLDVTISPSSLLAPAYDVFLVQ